jgi:hypothetical protein
MQHSGLIDGGQPRRDKRFLRADQHRIRRLDGIGRWHLGPAKLERAQCASVDLNVVGDQRWT